MEVNKKNLALAQIRYFDVAKNALEPIEPASYVVLFNRGDTYISLFNCGDFAPVYMQEEKDNGCVENIDSVSYENGSLVCGEVQDGEAWLLCDNSFFDKLYFEEEDVETVERLVLCSDLFFKDRIEIAKSVQKRYNLPDVSVASLIERDQKLLDEMNVSFAEREKQKVNKK